MRCLENLGQPRASGSAVADSASAKTPAKPSLGKLCIVQGHSAANPPPKSAVRSWLTPPPIRSTPPGIWSNTPPAQHTTSQLGRHNPQVGRETAGESWPSALMAPRAEPTHMAPRTVCAVSCQRDLWGPSVVEFGLGVPESTPMLSNFSNFYYKCLPTSGQLRRELDLIRTRLPTMPRMRPELARYRPDVVFCHTRPAVDQSKPTWV